MQAHQPIDESLAINWLDRFEHYYRMWTGICGLRNDIQAYLDWPHKYPCQPIPDQYRTGTLYHYAAFLYFLRRFELDRGGLWLLADANAEVAVSDLCYHITWHLPVSDDHGSWLRLIVARQRDQEQRPFTTALQHAPLGRLLIGRVSRWLDSCRCGPDPAPGRCEIHELPADCQQFLELIDRDWYRIADWYHLPPDHFGSEHDLRGQLLQRYESDLKQLGDEAGFSDDSQVDDTGVIQRRSR